MTTVQITLPDQLVQEAECAGLLSPASVENWLREPLRAQKWRELFEAIDRVSAVNDLPPMTPEEVAEEIKAMRTARRAKQARRENRTS